MPDFAFTQGIVVGSRVAFTAALTLIGPENHRSHFERSKLAFQAGASKKDVGSILEEDGGAQDIESSSVWGEGSEEKGRLAR